MLLDHLLELGDGVLQIDPAGVAHAALIVELIHDGVFGLGATDTGHGACLLGFVGFLLGQLLDFFPPVEKGAGELGFFYLRRLFTRILGLLLRGARRQGGKAQADEASDRRGSTDGASRGGPTETRAEIERAIEMYVQMLRTMR